MAYLPVKPPPRMGGPQEQFKWDSMVHTWISPKWVDLNSSFDAQVGYKASREYNGTGLNVGALPGTGSVDYYSTWVFEVPHDYYEGSDMIFHIHWCVENTGAGNVRLVLKHLVLPNGSVKSVTDVTSTVTTIAAPGVAWQLARTDIGTIPGAGLKYGDQVAAYFLRQPAHPSDTYTGYLDIFTFGVHYQSDSHGSETIGSKL